MKYIQFVGTQRSGSNLLRVMLNQEPEISAPHPPHILKTFFPLLPLYGNLEIESNFQSLVFDVCDWVNKNPVPWENVELDPKRLAFECKTSTLIELFSRIYEQKASRDGATIWCCKSMENVYYAKNIEAFGLRPFYIYLYRDGRDVALSFKKTFVGPKHIYHLAQKWRREQELAIQLLKELPENRFIAVCYEDLISNPRSLLQNICLKLEIPFREEILDYFHSHESQITASSGDMWKNLTQPIIQTNSNKFKKGLTETEIGIFENVAGNMLTHFDYELTSPIESRDFTKDELLSFDQINNQLIQEIKKNSDQGEKNSRKPQEDLLETIRSRVHTL